MSTIDWVALRKRMMVMNYQPGYFGATPLPPLSNWILTEGVWDDLGSWIDEDTWFDGIPTGDVDATAYLAAVTLLGGTVNETITTATNNLFTSLKTAGLYTKVKRLYPMIGSTKDSCSLEATLTSQNIYWIDSTGFTFTSNGIGCNGVNIRPAAKLSQTPYQIFGSGNNNISFSIYNRTSRGAAANFCVSASVGGDNNYFQLSLNYDGNNYTGIGKAFLITPASSSTGLFTVSRTSDSSQKLYQNGISAGELTTTGSSLSLSNEIGLFDMSEDNYSFLSFSDGLNDSEASTFYTIVQAFQTQLGREV